MFLGQHFLKTHQAKLSFSKNTDNTMELLLNTHIHAGEYIKIPPHSEAILSGIARASVEDGTEGYVYPFE
jgi:hypothetical protein